MTDGFQHAQQETAPNTFSFFEKKIYFSIPVSYEQRLVESSFKNINKKQKFCFFYTYFEGQSFFNSFYNKAGG
jgi:hypothetical protein